MNFYAQWPQSNSSLERKFREFWVSHQECKSCSKFLCPPLRGLFGRLLASPSSFHLTFLHQSVARASRGSLLRADKWLLVWLLIVSALSLAEQKQYSDLYMIRLPFSQQITILSQFHLLLIKVGKERYFPTCINDENLCPSHEVSLPFAGRSPIYHCTSDVVRSPVVGWLVCQMTL